MARPETVTSSGSVLLHLPYLISQHTLDFVAHSLRAGLAKMNPHNISGTAYLFHQCGRVSDLFQFQIGRDDQRLPAPVPAVNDKEHLLQSILRIPFHSQVVQNQKAVIVKGEISYKIKASLRVWDLDFETDRI